MVQAQYGRASQSSTEERFENDTTPLPAKGSSAQEQALLEAVKAVGEEVARMLASLPKHPFTYHLEDGVLRMIRTCEASPFRVEFGKPFTVSGLARDFAFHFNIVVFWRCWPKLMAVSWNEHGKGDVLVWKEGELPTHFDVMGWHVTDVLILLGMPSIANHMRKHGYSVTAQKPVKEFVNSYLETVLTVSNRIHKIFAPNLVQASPRKPLISIDVHYPVKGDEPYREATIFITKERAWLFFDGRASKAEEAKVSKEVFIDGYGQFRDSVLTSTKEYVVGYLTALATLKIM